MYSKRIAVDLAKNVFQLAECNHSGNVIARKRLNRIAFYKALTRLTEPTEIILKPAVPRITGGESFSAWVTKPRYFTLAMSLRFGAAIKRIVTIAMLFSMHRDLSI